MQGESCSGFFRTLTSKIPYNREDIHFTNMEKSFLWLEGIAPYVFVLLFLCTLKSKKF